LGFLGTMTGCEPFCLWVLPVHLWKLQRTSISHRSHYPVVHAKYKRNCCRMSREFHGGSVQFQVLLTLHVIPTYRIASTRYHQRASRPEGPCGCNKTRSCEHAILTASVIPSATRNLLLPLTIDVPLNPLTERSLFTHQRRRRDQRLAQRVSAGVAGPRSVSAVGAAQIDTSLSAILSETAALQCRTKTYQTLVIPTEIEEANGS
jgi:hypothetical protein